MEGVSFFVTVGECMSQLLQILGRGLEYDISELIMHWLKAARDYDHSDRCSHEGQLEALLELIRYDYSLRKVTVERSRLDPEMLEFLFGRPLSTTIRLFQLKLIKKGDLLTIVPYI